MLIMDWNKPKHPKISEKLINLAIEILKGQIDGLDPEEAVDEGWIKENENFDINDPNPEKSYYNYYDFPGQWPDLSGDDEEFLEWPKEIPLLLRCI